MKLTHFALGLMTVLVGITAYLAWEGQQEARGQRQELEFMRKQLEAREAAYPKKPASAFAPLSTEPVKMIPAPLTVPSPPAPLTAPENLPAPLTALQKQVLGMPSLAKIIQVEKNQGFVVVDAGRNKQFVTGQKFDVRRGNGVVGRVSITESIEDKEAIADIDPAISPPGVSIEPGDELILPVTK